MRVANLEERLINLLIVSGQLAQIDLIENALRVSLAINAHTSNDIGEIKKILSNESIDLIIIDTDNNTIELGAVKKVINDLQLNLPLLQLAHRNQAESTTDFINHGATMVCPSDQPAAILHYVELLLVCLQGKKLEIDGAQAIDDYRDKFTDLFQTLADPICYVTDGVFLDCNPAFLRAFELSDKSELDELTLLNFIARRHQSELKNHLKQASRRDMTASPAVFTLRTLRGEAAEYALMSKPSVFDGDAAVQVYFRSTSEAGGASTNTFDATTGLSNRDQMGYFLEQQIQTFKQDDSTGSLAYLMIKNYRDVWGSDGFTEAEKLIKAIAVHARKVLPAQTEASRYTDDGLLLFVPASGAKSVEKMFTDLIADLDRLTPDDMERMVEPSCYVAYTDLSKESDYLQLISALFRTARNAAHTEGTRVSMSTVNEVAKKDTQRLAILEDVIKNETIQIQFQPIVSFEPDGISRYGERLRLFRLEDDQPVTLDTDIMYSVAERYDMMHRLDQWKLNHLFNRLLGMSANSREPLRLFTTLSADAIKNPQFAPWLVEQMQHTGLGGKHFIFEMTVDNIINAYSGALKLSRALQDGGAKVAVTRIGSMSNENARVINDIKPDIIKLDVREIDTLDDSEELEVMGEIQDTADKLGAALVADHMESPAQLARIWNYDVKFIQGDGMTPILDELDFNFDEFAI